MNVMINQKNKLHNSKRKQIFYDLQKLNGHEYSEINMVI